MKYRTTLGWSYSSSAGPNQLKSTFCFSIFSNFVFNGFPLFSAAILDRSYKPSMLVCTPIQNNKLKIRMCKLDENSTKNEDVRVPHLKTTKTAVMTSFNGYSNILRKRNVFSICLVERVSVSAH